LGYSAPELENLLINAPTEFGRIGAKIPIEQVCLSCQRNIVLSHNPLIRRPGGIILANNFVDNALFANEFENWLKEVDI
jgi:hypothetical protein